MTDHEELLLRELEERNLVYSHKCRCALTRMTRSGWVRVEYNPKCPLKHNKLPLGIFRHIPELNTNCEYERPIENSVSV